MKKYQNYKPEIVLLCVAFLVVSTSFILSIYDDENFWFMRSGSIMVLLAVVVEYRLNQHTLKNINKKHKMSGANGFTWNLLNSKEHNKIAIVTHSFVVIGTLIWGYGDFLNK